MNTNIFEGIAIGVSVGITLGSINIIAEKVRELLHIRAIRKFLRVSRKEIKYQWRSTKAISSGVNLPFSRVEYLCHIDKKIKLSSGEKDGLWKLSD